MKGVFISYRQDDAKPWALLLRQDLVEAFGEEWVFLDKDTLHAGNWRAQIQQALDRSGVALVVIGRRWLASADDLGKRRLDSADDVHRQEIANALSRKDMTVIPVVVDGATLPRAEELTSDIRSLTDQQTHEISDNHAHRKLDLALLIGDIERATGLVARRPARRSLFLSGHRVAAGSLILAAVIAVSLAPTFYRSLWRGEGSVSQTATGADSNVKVENDRRELFAAIKPGVVRVESDGAFVGTGWFVNRSGAIMTTAYLAGRLKTDAIRVKLSNGSRVRAHLTTIDHTSDVALLNAEVPEGVTALDLASETLSQDDRVIAVVQSVDEEWFGVTGKVSRIGVDTPLGKGRIEVDIAESGGRLGSPVMNEQGAVVGVMQGSYENRPGYAFLIPIGSVKPMLEK